MMEEGKEIKDEIQVKRIPVRIDKSTVILVPEGADIESHVKRYKDHEYTGGCNLYWD